MVSVVMATYNGEKYITEQMDSIRCQTRMPDEVIFCDDCSGDNTVAVIEAYILRHRLSGWKVHCNDNNLGYFDNFFQAIFLAKGDTVYLSDQDDIWDLQKIQRFEEFYAGHPDTAMIQSNMRFIDDAGGEIPSSHCYHGKQEKTGIVELTVEDMCRFVGSGYTMSFRRSVSDAVQKNGLNQHKDVFLFHDILLGLMATALGKCYLYCGVYDLHRLHSNNVTQTQGKAYIADRTKAKQLAILDRRIQTFGLITLAVPESANDACFRKYREFASRRRDLIQNRKFSGISFLLKNKDCYASRWGLITDVLYALNCEKLLLFLFRRIRRI